MVQKLQVVVLAMCESSWLGHMGDVQSRSLSLAGHDSDSSITRYSMQLSADDRKQKLQIQLHWFGRSYAVFIKVIEGEIFRYI